MVAKKPRADNVVGDRPTALPVNVDGIPAELREGKRFVVWKYTFKKGRWTKPLYRPSGELADSTKPDTWVTFAEAVSAYQEGGWDGIGRIHLPEDNLVGFDADDCVDPETGQTTGGEADLVRRLDTYAEVSPSGTGLRAFAHGQKPGTRCVKKPFEMYNGATADGTPGGRYLTLTGHHLPGTPTTINDRQAEIATVYREVFGEQTGPPPRRRPGPAGTAEATGTDQVDLDEDEIIRRASAAPRTGAAFRALWAGDLSGHNNNPSSADLALCNLLRWWTRANRGQVDRLFRRSGLMRDKWDEKRGTTTYGGLTLNTAMPGKIRESLACRYVRSSNGNGTPPTMTNRHQITHPRRRHGIATWETAFD